MTMITFDLLGAVALTASAAIMIALLAASYAGPPLLRIGIGAALGLWFALIAALGAAGAFGQARGLGTPGVGLAVLLPVLVLGLAKRRVAGLRSALDAAPIELLVGVNFVRVLGAFFILLYADGRLPAPFAPVAGWGDILIGATALPLAWAIGKQIPGWWPATLAWNTLGLADLLAAISLGITSAPDSPLRLFHDGPSTVIMTDLPWVLIPAFLVPLLILTHIAVFYRLAAASFDRQSHYHAL
jgi:hypothetical protein